MSKGYATFSIPRHFALVEKGVYRSAYPEEQHVAWLRHIGIKTLVLLSIELLPASVERLLLVPESEGVVAQRLNIINVASLESWVSDPMGAGNDFSQADVERALALAVRVEYHPLLFACPTGELQTSVVMGCLRRYQRRTLSSILGECEMFLSKRCSLRSSVISFIESWHPAAHSLHVATCDDVMSLKESCAEWYVLALQCERALLEPRNAGGAVEEEGASAAPHIVYEGVRNPPSLSPLSSFNPKLSSVEDDDD